MKNNKKIYCWACDYVPNHGEGLLSRKFIKLLKKKLNYDPIIISPVNFNYKEINFSFGYKYLSPIFGIIVLWYYFLQGKKVCYLNFLPLWNTFLFLFLPPSTILGPITGFFYKNKIRGLEEFIRKKIIPILFRLNYFLLKLRLKKILFSTANLKEMFNDHKHHIYNFSLFDFKQNMKLSKKTIDFLVYYRKYSTKENDFIINLINKLLKKKLIIRVVGHKMLLNSKKKINYGFLSRNSLLKIMKNTKYTILSGENLFSFFALDALSKKVIIFHNKKNISSLKKKDLKYYFVPLDYNNLNKSYKIIIQEIKRKKNLKLKLNFTKLNNFNSYFEQFFDNYSNYKKLLKKDKNQVL